ncbi:hypothetical protein ACE7GA_00770 [Roseomonas sp. CCTCC AB2023176]|uniref:hypothetical protein n=1 Tax=Roseomonas sp. CCTCC AB2023176 TaxID=3342640 RepID=UPI0035E35BB1
MSSWFVRLDRYGEVHMVRAQDKVIKNGADVSNSCGIASIIMVNFKVKKHLILRGFAAGSAVSAVPIVGSFAGAQLAKAGIDAAVKTEPEIYQIYGKVVGSIYDGSTYTNCTKHPPVLQQLGLGEWEAVWVGPGGMYDAIKATVEKGYPCIVRCGWNSGGGHFMVVDGVNTEGTTTISVCDPWDGELRIVRAASGQTINYDPASEFSFSVGERHEYDAPSPGTLSGWIVRNKAI